MASPDPPTAEAAPSLTSPERMLSVGTTGPGAAGSEPTVTVPGNSFGHGSGSGSDAWSNRLRYISDEAFANLRLPGDISGQRPVAAESASALASGAGTTASVPPQLATDSTAASAAWAPARLAISAIPKAYLDAPRSPEPAIERGGRAEEPESSRRTPPPPETRDRRKR
ncbi:hypothetical protein [Streptomyces sp. NPDC059949]|uniref:hypothetical protein n=1 Tax=Streptomyces sp. NPDC059949 TaxID=3347013 RepID=UPI003666925C